MAGFDVKTIVGSILLAVFFCAMSTEADDEKHDYTIDIVKVTVNDMKESIIDKATYFGDGIHNDIVVINATLKLKKELPDSVVNLYGFEQNPMNNLWMEKFKQSHPFCEFIEKNTYFMDNVYKDSDFPRGCPIPAGEYYIRNMMVDVSEFPKHLKEAQWRLDLDLVNKMTKEYILRMSFYVNIVAIEEDE